MNKDSPQALMYQTMRLKPERISLGLTDYYFSKKKSRKFRKSKLILIRRETSNFPKIGR